MPSANEGSASRAEGIAQTQVPAPTTRSTEHVVHYVCKYTPLELFAGFGVETEPLNTMPDDIDTGDYDIPANLCGFGRSVLAGALAGQMRELVLVNCCDVMRRVYEILEDEGCCDFLYLLDLPHCITSCAAENFARSLVRLRDAYAAYSGLSFDLQACLDAFQGFEGMSEDYIGIVGVRAGDELEDMIRREINLPVRNLTCTHNRNVALDEPPESEDGLWEPYALAIMGQTPCMRMASTAERMHLLNDPHLKGVVYHTIQFCDFYGMEYAQLRERSDMPMLKIETDFTKQSAGQLSTRITAFSEALGSLNTKGTGERMELAPGQYVAGLDSGSTTTKVIVMDGRRNIVASAITSTGGGAQDSAEKSLGVALEQAGIPRDSVVRIVATGYGRDFINSGDESITEISCHAKGANFLDPRVRTIIDIGGQDSKVIRVNEAGVVENFVMNDKCAAGTGRFLDMMSRALGISLDEMSRMGVTYKEDIQISSMCTVFAESEVVTLVAQNKPVNDIVHGLDRSVATKVGSLVKRGKGEPVYMMTGGVAHNTGVVRALEERIGSEVLTSKYAQLCGAIGAALFALEGK